MCVHKWDLVWHRRIARIYKINPGRGMLSKHGHNKQTARWNSTGPRDPGSLHEITCRLIDWFIDFVCWSSPSAKKMADLFSTCSNVFDRFSISLFYYEAKGFFSCHYQNIFHSLHFFFFCPLGFLFASHTPFSQLLSFSFCISVNCCVFLLYTFLLIVLILFFL